jgi:hypothetical protein
MTGRNALLWMTHMWNPELEAEFERFLHSTYPGSPEVWLILDSRTPGAENIIQRFKRCHVIAETEMFRRLPYPRLKNETLYEHVHFPILDFYLTHPQYDFYWVVEFDVRYTGKWESFLRSFELYDHDLITSHIRHFDEEPDFWWWDTLHHPARTIDRSRYLRSFNVIYRISNRALALIHNNQQEGWRGYPEVLLPTLLAESGYTLLDFGGDGKFVLPGYKNRFYTSGSAGGLLNPFCTMCWRPSRLRPGIRRNKIYHPVKSKLGLEPVKERFLFCTRWTWKYLSEKLTRNR